MSVGTVGTTGGTNGTGDLVRVVPLTCHGHSRPVTYISFSALVSNGTTSEVQVSGGDSTCGEYYLISACKDNNPQMRTGSTGDWIGTFLGHKGAVWQAKLSNDAALAATASADFSARVWDTTTGECLSALQHGHIVKSVAFVDRGSMNSSNGNAWSLSSSTVKPGYLATGGMEKRLRLFDLDRALSVNPTDNNEKLNCTDDCIVYETDVNAHGGTIKSIVWSPDASLLVTACEDKKLRWWDLRARSVVATYEVEGRIGSCELDVDPATCSVSQNSEVNKDDHTTSDQGNSNDGGAWKSAQTISVAAGQKVYFFNSKVPHELIRSWDLQHEVASVSLSPTSINGGNSERRFVTGAIGNTWLRVWDWEQGKCLEVGKGHHGPIWSVAFSPDGKLYATGSEDGTIKLWKFTSQPYGLWR